MRPAPAARVATLAACLVLLTGCGLAHTQIPYTPGAGVNIDTVTAKVRNLVIVSSGTSGFVSGSVLSTVADSLASIKGTPIKADGSPGTAFSSTTAPLRLMPATLTVLTDGPAITVSSPDLTPGLIADVTVTFSSGASAQLSVPIVDAAGSVWKDVKPKG